MSVEHFIQELREGTLVIVPGDRPDILLASLACTLSPVFPAVAGVVLTAGYKIDPTVGGCSKEHPSRCSRSRRRTHLAASAIHAVQPSITADNERKIATALGLFESGSTPSELEKLIALARPARTTPVMFEYELIERAKAKLQHIVLPEGGDDRILRAADLLLRRRVVELTILGDADEIRSRAPPSAVDLGDAEILTR